MSWRAPLRWRAHARRGTGGPEPAASRRAGRARLRGCLGIVALIGLGAPAGCRVEGIFRPPEASLERMAHQPRYDAYQVNEFFVDRRAMRPPPEGTVPKSMLVGDPGLEYGVRGGSYVTEIPIAVNLARIARGRGRYDIFCAPCHGVLGDGSTVVAANMRLVKPPSLLSDAVRTSPAGRIARIIRDGYGVMPAYQTQLPPEDRWAVVAYVQALQLASRSALSELSGELQREARESLP